MQRKLQALFSSTDIYTLASVLKIVPPSSLNWRGFRLHTAVWQAENLVVQSMGKQPVLCAKLGLAARGRTAWVLLMHPGVL